MRMQPSNTALLVVDMQDKLISGVQRRDSLSWNVNRLIRAASIFKIYCIYTLQNPVKLGYLSQKVITKDDSQFYDKTTFSCFTCNELVNRIKTTGISNILICGLETHICILQSTIDFLESNYRVFIAVDAVSSRFDIDHKTAIRRLESSGATLTSTESVLFEWCLDSSKKEFKEVSCIAKEII